MVNFLPFPIESTRKTKLWAAMHFNSHQQSKNRERVRKEEKRVYRIDEDSWIASHILCKRK